MDYMLRASKTSSACLTSECGNYTETLRAMARDQGIHNSSTDRKFSLSLSLSSPRLVGSWSSHLGNSCVVVDLRPCLHDLIFRDGRSSRDLHCLTGPRKDWTYRSIPSIPVGCHSSSDQLPSLTVGPFHSCSQGSSVGHHHGTGDPSRICR